MKKYNILVTPKEACDVLSKLDTSELECEFTFAQGRIENRDVLKNKLEGADAVILDLEKIDRTILKDNHRLKVISRFGVGHDSVDKHALAEKNITLTITYGVSSDAVARHALALILSSMHNIGEHTQNAHQNNWIRKRNISYSEAKIGLVGYGQIAKLLGIHLKNLGFDFCFYTRNNSQSSSLDSIIRECKIISIHLPKTDETTNLFDRNMFDKMNSTIVVNTSRGGIVNEEDLIVALDKGQVKTYASDVFLHEPYDSITAKLIQHPKVISTPHLASFDNKTAKDMALCAFDNALCILKGKNLSSHYQIMI